MEALYQLDVRLFHFANGVLTAPWADAFFRWITAPPGRIPLFVLLWLALFTLAGRRGRAAALTLIFVVAVADSLGTEIKWWIARPRPCFTLPDVRLLVPGQPHSGSFPSNHALNSFAVAVLLLDVSPILGAIGFVVAVLVIYSRVYLGVHYPSDVLAGALLGSTLAYAGIRVREGISGLRRRWGF